MPSPLDLNFYFFEEKTHNSYEYESSDDKSKDISTKSYESSKENISLKKDRKRLRKIRKLSIKRDLSIHKYKNNKNNPDNSIVKMIMEYKRKNRNSFTCPKIIIYQDIKLKNKQEEEEEEDEEEEEVELNINEEHNKIICNNNKVKSKTILEAMKEELES